MKNRLCSFLSRLALPGLAAPLILLSPAFVGADTITTFDVSGTVMNIPPDGILRPLSDMFQVDTTNGTIQSSGFDITIPGFPSFNILFGSEPAADGIDWEIRANNNVFDVLLLSFTPAPNPGSLVGFTGASNLTGCDDGCGPFPSYVVTGGSITPVPEPSSLVLLAGGIGWLVFGLTRRFRKKSAT